MPEKINDVNAREPMLLSYMKFLRFTLHMIGSWPYHIFGENVKSMPFRHAAFLFTEWSFFLISGLIYIKTNRIKVSFDDMAQTYFTVCVNAVIVQRGSIPLLHFKVYPEVIRTFVSEIHLMHHRHLSDYTEAIYQRIYKLSTRFVKVIFLEVFIGLLLFYTTPIYNNWRKGMFQKEPPPDTEFESSANYALPFNYQTNLYAYILVTVFNFIASVDCGLCFGAYDLLLSVILFHVWGHLKILDYNCRNFPTPKKLRDQKSSPCDELKFTPEENKKVSVMLQGLVNHHRMILGFIKKTSEAFGPMLCMYYMFHQVSECILLLKCSKMDTASLGKYAPLTLVTFQMLIQLSFIIELLGTQSEMLKDAVYSIPWEYMNNSNRKITLVLLCNVQTPIRLKPMGLVSVGVQTMASIIKTSFSYFLMLRAFVDNA